MTLTEFYLLHSRLTRSLRKFIEDYQSQLDAPTYSAFLQSLSDEISERSETFFKLPEPADRARLLHFLADEEIAKGADVPLSCKKGCSACCHMEVEITNYEADILKDLVKAGHQIDIDRLTKQSQRDLQDPLWKQGPRNTDSQCVFLDQEGSCSIYEHRPVMCRRHSVSSPAINCFNLDAPVTVRYFPRLDLMISAANEDKDLRIGPMAKMLLKSLKTPSETSTHE